MISFLTTFFKNDLYISSLLSWFWVGKQLDPCIEVISNHG